MKMDLLKLNDHELQEGLEELSKEELVQVIMGLRKCFKEDYEQFNMEIDNTPFERIRRITGYLVGTLDRFNNAKRDEEAHRVKHMTAVDFNEEK